MKSWVFQTNPYDPCVINKVVDKNWWNLFWQVGYLKNYHVESTVVDDILQRLEEQYGKVDLLTMNPGKIHDYVVMLLDLSTNREGESNCVQSYS